MCEMTDQSPRFSDGLSLPEVAGVGEDDDHRVDKIGGPAIAGVAQVPGVDEGRVASMVDQPLDVAGPVLGPRVNGLTVDVRTGREVVGTVGITTAGHAHRQAEDDEKEEYFIAVHFCD